MYKCSSGILLICIHVDDFIVLASSQKLYDEFYEKLSNKKKGGFTCTNLGTLQWYLGCEIQRCPKTGLITLNQTEYIIKMIKRFGMWDANTKPTPVGDLNDLQPKEMLDALHANDKTKSNDKKDEPIDFPYRQATGALLWALHSRPDIRWIVPVLCSFNNNPHKLHVAAVKNVFKYLRGTLNLGIGWDRTGKFEMEAFVDADFGGKTTVNAFSYSGYFLMVNGGPLDSFAKRQRTVAQSSCESEYYALQEVTKTIIFARELFTQLSKYIPQIELKGPTRIWEDNESVIAIVKSVFFSSRSRHFRTKKGFVQDEQQKGTINVQGIASSENLADLNTKGLVRQKFEYLRDKVMRVTKPSVLSNNGVA